VALLPLSVLGAARMAHHSAALSLAAEPAGAVVVISELADPDNYKVNLPLPPVELSFRRTVGGSSTRG
jgi:hypothetical protein